jgi:hypothetical protein
LLINYRVTQLEKKVEIHNKLAERMIAVEISCKNNCDNITDLEGDIKEVFREFRELLKKKWRDPDVGKSQEAN